MNATTIPAPPPGRIGLRRLAAVAPALAVALAGLALGLRLTAGGHSAPAAPPVPGHTPTSPAIEARYGMRVVQVGLTADGGMLDLRFIAVDPAKVDQLTAHHSPRPTVGMRLLVESTGTVLSTEAMAPHGDGLRAGAEYFTIFRNDGGTIHEGSRVTLIVGGLRLRHLVVL
jgi:hypothetical protein